MMDLVKDWRAWFWGGLIASYVLVAALAWPDRSMPEMSDAEIDAIIDHHIANCDLMGADGYAGHCLD